MPGSPDLLRQGCYSPSFLLSNIDILPAGGIVPIQRRESSAQCRGVRAFRAPTYLGEVKHRFRVLGRQVGRAHPGTAGFRRSPKDKAVDVVSVLE